MNNFNNLMFTRNISPFSSAGSTITKLARNGATSGLLSKKISLSSILTGAQKTIGTINQIVPLYNQVKPMFQNSKILLSVAKGLKGTPRRKQNYYRPQRQETPPIDINETITITPTPTNNGSTPSKPFFI